MTLGIDKGEDRRLEQLARPSPEENVLAAHAVECGDGIRQVAARRAGWVSVAPVHRLHHCAGDRRSGSIGVLVLIQPDWGGRINRRSRRSGGGGALCGGARRASENGRAGRAKSLHEMTSGQSHDRLLGCQLAQVCHDCCRLWGARRASGSTLLRPSAPFATSPRDSFARLRRRSGRRPCPSGDRWPRWVSASRAVRTAPKRWGACSA